MVRHYLTNEMFGACASGRREKAPTLARNDLLCSKMPNGLRARVEAIRASGHLSI